MDNITNNNINTNTDNAETPDITKETNLGRQLSDDEFNYISQRLKKGYSKMIRHIILYIFLILLGLISAYIIIADYSVACDGINYLTERASLHSSSTEVYKPMLFVYILALILVYMVLIFEPIMKIKVLAKSFSKYTVTTFAKGKCVVKDDAVEEIKPTPHPLYPFGKTAILENSKVETFIIPSFSRKLYKGDEVYLVIYPDGSQKILKK